MAKLFISHATADDAFVRKLREQVELFGLSGWVDSRELRGGDSLWPEIKAAIEKADAFVVVVSPDSLQSQWVGRELKHAMSVQESRGRDAYRVVPLSIDGTRLGVMQAIFDDTPVYIEASADLAGAEAVLGDLLEASGTRLPTERFDLSRPDAPPLEDLVLELSDLKMEESEGVRRPTARARLVYRPAAPGMPDVNSKRSWRLRAPLGPIEADDLRWYLEKYAVWPSAHFKDRAKRVEDHLSVWGRLLHEAALPLVHTEGVMRAWARVDDGANRRFSVRVDDVLEAGAPEADVASAKEAATLLLGQPWELIRNEERFLFQGASPTRVRRRLRGTLALKAPLLIPPIRILLVTARPEDDVCGYIDHRASALPLVEATEALGGLVDIRVLRPATLPALRDELDRARDAGTPYHVVHFDGHGGYDKRVGLGGRCFENASESVASGLLKVGVASVIAMSHSVLVETARRFVHSFYKKLAEGGRVGDAMLAGQRELKDDTLRGRIFGLGELRLEDWFVPVLYQEEDDPQLFRATPAPRTQDNVRKALSARMGRLPEPPPTGFIGRSRDMLAIERLLRRERYAAIRGQGGEGKTAIAAELGRWMVRSRQVQRAAFVSVELNTNAAAVANEIGPQLVPDFQTVTAATLEDGLKAIERALRAQATLLIVDNMESILPPPSVAAQRPEVLAEEAQAELDGILALCARLNGIGTTRIIFTTRQPLPAPFDGDENRIELVRLAKRDAVELVSKVLSEDERATIERVGSVEGLGADERARIQAASDAAVEEIEELVDAVHCNARALTNLAPSIRALGVTRTRASLVELMAKMEADFPGSREQSVYASVELSLRRMSEANRERARALGVFYGGVDLDVLRTMMGWSKEDVVSLAVELVTTGLATPNRYNHLTLNPALCPYLHGRLDPAERDALTAEWAQAMGAYVNFLDHQQSRNAEVAATLTGLELAGLLALLEHVQHASNAEATIDLATALHSLFQTLGKSRLTQRVGQARDDAARALRDTWGHAAFLAAQTRVEQQLGSSRLQEALTGAKDLLARARAAGEGAYEGADYDLAMACWQMGRALQTGGDAEQSLPLQQEAERRFEAVGSRRPGRGAERMARVCITEQGDCLLDLGRLDEAASAYEEAIRRAEASGDERSVAVGKGQLGTARLLQRRYRDALDAYAEARQRFTNLDEPGSLATAWHQTGMAYQHTGQPEAAEEAYQKSLAIEVRLGNLAGQAATLGQLGNLYNDLLNRPEEAATQYQQAVDLYVQIGDVTREGRTRTNRGRTLKNLKRFDEARREIHRAIECKAEIGHAGTPWNAWDILAGIEIASGNTAAAAEATANARAAYLAYRRDGGENHAGSGRLAHDVAQALDAGEVGQAATLLQQLAADPRAGRLLPFIQALRSITTGNLKSDLADDPRLGYDEAAEITLLLEALRSSNGA